MGRLRLLALSIAGAVCGHTLAYALSFPDRMSRQSVLRVTGHAYWHAAVAGAVVSVLWFATSHLARHARATQRGERISQRALPTFALLATLQLAVFIGMETSERVAAGAPVATIFDHRILLTGLVVQFVVAGALTIASFVLGRVGDALGRALAWSGPIARSGALWSTPAQHWPAALAVVPCGSRGPPTS